MSLIRPLLRFTEREALQPDFGRALRATVAFMGPLIAAHFGGFGYDATLTAIAAQNIAMVDVRGAYRFRIGLLVVMTAILAGAVALGAFAGTSVLLAVIATGVMGLGAGAWRHLSADYGLSLGIASLLLFFISMSVPGAAALVGDHATAAVLGGAWGLLLQVINWPFRPQHPLRQTAAESWLAAADLFAAMMASEAGQPRCRQAQEVALRTTLDKTERTLSHATKARATSARLMELNRAAARLTTHANGFYSAFESASARPEIAALTSSLQPLLNALTNTARTVALAVVSRQPAHLATFDVRARRLGHLVDALRARITAQAGDHAEGAQLADLLRQVGEQLPAVATALRATLDRAEERAAFSLELFDLQTWSLRPLASALNFSRHLDPALVRYTARIAVLMMAGTAVYRYLGLPHGYWLPFTMIVVLQPDYGSTRRRAAQRGLGTLAGSIVASGLLWIHLPPSWLLAATAPMVFGFGYCLKRNYAVAVFCVTLFVVLVTEAVSPVTLAFTVERVLITLAGGALALGAALVFWPAWERDRLPRVIAAALRANRAYLDVLALRLTAGGGYDPDAITAKRAAETANSEVFASLQRMIGDPKNQQERLEQAAALANGNQRLTRAFTVIALQLKAGAPLHHPAVAAFTRLGDEVFDVLAAALESPAGRPVDHTALLHALDTLSLPAPLAPAEDEARREQGILTQFGRAATELSAMLRTELPDVVAIPQSAAAGISAAKPGRD